MKKLTLTINYPEFLRLHQHLFPGDHDEHGAVLAVGSSEDDNHIRLLVREVFLAQDGVDYVPGTRGYRALTAQYVAEKSDFCAAMKLGYLAVHCHGGTDRVKFSSDDLASQERGYPALMDITDGGPVGALVFAENAIAGRVWLPGKSKLELDFMNVVGAKNFRLYPQPPKHEFIANPVYDRSARIFGDVGQQTLSNLNVGIIGLGGVGSLVNEWLARLGVGTIIAIDFDKIETTNLSRVVGATRWDAQALLTKSSMPELVKKLGTYLARFKVDIARRVARTARPNIVYKAIRGNIVDQAIAEELKNVDFIFLAADSMQSRLVFNALVHQYLIPGAQIGAKVSIGEKSKKITDIFTASRIVLPIKNAGCLYCNGLISPSKLQEESLTPEERKQQRYVDSDEVIEPSVITLNVNASAPIINDFMMMFTGLYSEDMPLPYILQFPLERQFLTVEATSQATCAHCSNHVKSVFARGDRSRLPCRA